jgi:predicted peptidase
MKILLTVFISFILIISIYSQQEKQTPHNFQKEVRITLTANYLLYLPADYADSDKEFPLVLFLHGAGERGNDLEKVKVHGLPRLVNEGKNFPFIVVSPQCPDLMLWNTDVLSSLLDEIEANYKVDKNRIYVTGLSMGGHGTWSLALAQPDRFAAIAPVCGWADTTKANTISHLPIWVFHGAKDAVVPVKTSEDMVAALKNFGSDVKFTIYPEANHDSWTETYNNEELYKWLLEQSLENTKL